MNARLIRGEGFAADSSLIGGDAGRDRRAESVDAIREGKRTRPVREYLDALDAGNPIHQGGARYLSLTDPAAAWNTKEGRGKFGYINNYLFDTAHAVIVDWKPHRRGSHRRSSPTKAMLGRVEEKHSLGSGESLQHRPFLGWRSHRKVTAHIPVPDRQHQTEGVLPRESFTFDAAGNPLHLSTGQNSETSHCPRGNRIHIYRATEGDCKECPIRPECRRGEKRTLSVSRLESMLHWPKG